MDEEEEEEAFSYFKHGAIDGPTDRPPRAIHATRLAILAGASIVWEGRGQESTRHAYASLRRNESGIFWTERIGPISSSSRHYSKWAGDVRTHERWYLAAVQHPSPKLGQQNTSCQSIRR